MFSGSVVHSALCTEVRIVLFYSSVFGDVSSLVFSKGDSHSLMVKIPLSLPVCTFVEYLSFVYLFWVVSAGLHQRLTTISYSLLLFKVFMHFCLQK